MYSLAHPPILVQTQTMKPIIGITTAPSRRETIRYNSLSENYTRSVKAAGGIPLLLPFDLEPAVAEEYISLIHGIIFSGGGDPAPSYYDQEPVRGVNRISHTRDESELALFALARNRRLPVFGICRGMQLINIALGGDLIQDIPSQCPQSQNHFPQGLGADELYHRILIPDGDSIIGRCLGSGKVKTNSLHHQAIGKLGKDIKVTATTDDGIVEAFEYQDSSWYLNAVQFHPEALTGEHPAFLRLFSDFVGACRPH